MANGPTIKEDRAHEGAFVFVPYRLEVRPRTRGQALTHARSADPTTGSGTRDSPGTPAQPWCAAS